MARARKDLVQQLPEDEQPTDVVGFLAWLEELQANIPPDAWAEIPTDLSVNFDYYAYGHPKQQP
jgi:hypothetical protein